MIKLLLEQYAKTKMINLPQEFSAPKETKLEEINYVLNKVNKDNFYELCDIEYRDILEDRLYLFPETKINFIVAIDKMFNPIEKIKHLVDGKVYNMPAFVANGYWRDKVDNKEYMELASKAKVVKFDEADEDFHAFMNSCNIFCNLPYEKRDPLKWDKKNIGRYFSL